MFLIQETVAYPEKLNLNVSVELLLFRIFIAFEKFLGHFVFIQVFVRRHSLTPFGTGAARRLVPLRSARWSSRSL